MITAATIGTNGRLGNQMFQYAALLGIARHKNYNFYSPGGRLFEVFEMKSAPRNSNNHFNNHRLSERMFSFDQYLFDNAPDNVDLFGYFQSKKYWNHCEQEVLDLFSFKEKINYDLQKLCEDACFLHVRRTDYLNAPEFHTNIGLNYYKDSIKHIESKTLLIFSDDIQWCKVIFSDLDEVKRFKVIYASEVSDNDIQDLQLMTYCSSAIIANSSFSWWVAYLGPHQKAGKIVAPSRWFAHKGPQDTQDIYLENWLKVDV